MTDVSTYNANGRRAPKGAPALLASSFLTGGALPAYAPTSDHLSEITDWTMLGNDKYGDCGPVSVANQRRIITKVLGGTEYEPTLDDVFALYRASGNPQFDPTTDADDNGVDMQTMCEALVSTGIAGVKAVAFAKVNVGDLAEVRAAIDVFGSVLFGVNLEIAQQDQTNASPPVWDWVKSGPWGGHAVVAGKYNSGSTGPDISIVTWAEVVGVTDAFTRYQLEEAWVVIWPEHLGTAEFQAGVDVNALATAYNELTGKTFVVPTPVTPPQPTPPAPTPPAPTPPGPGAGFLVDLSTVAGLAEVVAHRAARRNMSLADYTLHVLASHCGVPDPAAVDFDPNED